MPELVCDSATESVRYVPRALCNDADVERSLHKRLETQVVRHAPSCPTNRGSRGLAVITRLAPGGCSFPDEMGRPSVGYFKVARDRQP
jgi:hypothetical protein